MVINVIAAIVAIIVLGVLIMTSIDLTSFSISNGAQMAKLAANEVVLVKDTVDFNLFGYTAKSTDNEPYMIYKAQAGVATLFMVAGYAVSVVVAYIALVIVIQLLSKFGFIDAGLGGENAATAFPIQAMAVIGLGFASGYALMYFYNTRFKQQIQPTLKNAKYSGKDLNREIYERMTTDAGFLSSLKSGTSAYLTIMGTKAASSSVDCLKKMMFTLALRDLITQNVPQASGTQYDTMMRIFESNNITNRTIDIVQYLAYGKPNILLNVFVSNSAVIDALNITSATFKGDLVMALNTDVQAINKGLHKYKALGHVKESMLSFMVTMVLVSIVAFLFILIIHASQVMDIILKIVEVVKAWRKPESATTPATPAPPVTTQR
jgi:hypothetical protein